MSVIIQDKHLELEELTWSELKQANLFFEGTHLSVKVFLSLKNKYNNK